METTDAKELVRRALWELIDQRDETARERWWSDGYIDHSVIQADGPGLLPDGTRYTMTRMLAENDLVVMHGRYASPGTAGTAAFDLWRVEDGKIAEHWDAHQAWAGETVSGHTMTDGRTDPGPAERSAGSRQVVSAFAELIMMGGDRTQIGRFFAGDQFIQHNPQIADGVSGLGQAIQTGVWAAVVDRIHRIVADGVFVFTQGEGTLRGEPAAFYDLFRVAEDGTLAEHWDVVFAKPATLPHGNGLF